MGGPGRFAVTCVGQHPMRSIPGRKRAERGASLVEFAIIAPLLFLLLFGIIELGRAVATFNAVNTAAREGTRYGTGLGESAGVPGLPRFLDCDGIRNAARSRANMVSLSDADIVIEYDKGPNDPDPPVVYGGCQEPLVLPDGGEVASEDRIVVTVRHEFESPIPLISNFIGLLEIEGRQARTIFRAVIDD